jgi:Flp pilus assembly protein TadG
MTVSAYKTAEPPRPSRAQSSAKEPAQIPVAVLNARPPSSERHERVVPALGADLRSSEGQEIAEAALVLPLVFLFLLGIVWFGRAFNIYSTIQQAAQQGALAAARPTCATCGSATPFGGGAAVDTAVAAVMNASSVSPSQIVNPGAATSPCTNSPSYNITVCQQVVLSATPPLPSPLTTCGSPPDPNPTQFCGMLVTFQYPFTFYLPFTSLNLSTINLTAQAQTRMEN